MAPRRKPVVAAKQLSLVAVAVFTVGALNVLLGLTGLSGSFVVWSDWFEEGVLNHYWRVRDWLFGYLPFSLPPELKDCAIVYSGLVFWASQSVRAITDVEVIYETIGTRELWIERIFRPLGGPIVIIQDLFVKPLMGRSVAKFIEQETGRTPDVVDFEERFTEAVSGARAAIVYTALALSAGYIGLLFLGTEFLDKAGN